MNNPGGRPRALTDQKQDELIHHIGLGATVAEAAQIVGVSLRTVQREAKEDEEFAQDLELARRAAPTDPYQLMLQAARTHWRAAAWLLERSDPDRFGKRPPNSCRPEQVRDLASLLIEAMLQSVPSDQRELLDSRLQAVAHGALEALLPDRRKSEIVLAAYRPTPQDEYRGRRTSASKRDQAPASEQQSKQAAAWETEEVLSPKMRLATKPAVAEHAAQPPTPAREEVLSPEMRVATEPTSESIAAKRSPKIARAVDRKALHVKERAQARRVRRQTARAKRKARKAA
jgi:hypothetical protein